jgi:hypothetical protein
MSGVTVPTMMTPMSSGRSPLGASLRGRRWMPSFRGRDARIHDVALADAGALQDPFVGRVDHPFEVGVAQHARRHVGRQRPDGRRPSSHAGGPAFDYHSRDSLCVRRARSARSNRRPAASRTALRRAVEEADLDQERLVDVLDRVLFLADSPPRSCQADRTAAELVDDRPQQLPIDVVEPVLVDLQQLQAGVGDLSVIVPLARTWA